MHNAPPNRNSLDQLLAALKGLSGAPGQLPPVESWNPTYCGDAGFEILADGTWRHQGGRIARAAMVRLFASILRQDEDGETYLVTPVEKIRVRVEDAHFLAIRADRQGQGEAQTIVFTTNVGDVFPADAAHPIRVALDPATGAPRPYVNVRGRLQARILRAPFLELVDWAIPAGDRLELWSAGARFDLGSIA